MHHKTWKGMLSSINDYISVNQDLDHQDIIDKIKEKLAEIRLDIYLKWKSKGFNLNYLFPFQGEHIDNKYTLLYIATCYGFENIVRALLAGGAKVDVVDNMHGATPLHFAARNSNVELVRILLANKACANAIDYIHGATPLHFVARNGHVELVNILLENDANVNSVDDRYGATPLHVAAGNGHVDAVKILLENEACINTSDNKYGATPLHGAAGNGYADVVEILLDKSANIRATDKSVATPLHWAARNGHVTIVRALLEKDAEIDALDKDLATPLHWAARNGHIAVVSALLEKGANAFFQDKNAQTPMDLASSRDVKRLFSELREREYTKLVIISCAAVFLAITFALTMWRKKLTFIERATGGIIVIIATAVTALVVGIKYRKPQPNTQVNRMHIAGVHYNPRNSEISIV